MQRQYQYITNTKVVKKGAPKTEFPFATQNTGIHLAQTGKNKCLYNNKYEKQITGIQQLNRCKRHVTYNKTTQNTKLHELTEQLRLFPTLQLPVSQPTAQRQELQ